MEVYRITQKKYADKLKASGAPNRWNKENEFVIYTSESKSLCILELLANRNGKMKNQDYNILTILIPNKKTHFQIIRDLDRDWKSMKNYNILQNIGSDWYKNKNSLVLKIPTVILDTEFNFVINTKHPEFDKVKILSNEPFVWDTRIHNLLK